MKLILEVEGIKLLENKGKYYLEYNAGTHMVKNKRIEISEEEGISCQYDLDGMYNIILEYQNNGVYGEDVFE